MSDLDDEEIKATRILNGADKEINENKTMSDEEKKALKNFKSEYETCNYNSSDLIIELDDAKIILDLIEKQSKEIEELKDIINKEHELNLDKRYVELKYVSKDKIKAKIEERQKRIEQLHPGSDCVIIDDLETEIAVLQSLLEKE